MNSMPEDKGKLDGACNRSACLKPAATWFNHSTRAYYCRRCALLLNDVNRDWAPAQYGHDLCTEGVPNKG